MPRKSVAVLGLDAMPPSFMRRLVELGIMPNTGKILNKGFFSELLAVPPVTPPSWASIMTGVNPGKHGIMGFIKYDRKNWSQNLFTSLDLEFPRVHEMLSMRGLRSIVFNPMPDYPIIPVSKSTIVSNLFFTPEPKSWPSDAILEYFGESDPSKIVRSLDCNSVAEYIDVLNLYQEAIQKALKKDYSLLWITLNIPDIIFHRCPQILSGTLSGDARKVFSIVDKIIKNLEENHDYIVVVSDHGFAEYKYFISVNDILLENKLAKATREKKLSESGDFLLGKGILRDVKRPFTINVSPKLYSLIRSLGLAPVAKALLRLGSVLTGRRIKVTTNLRVDPHNSVAFMPDHYSFGVFVNDPLLKDEVKKTLRKYDEALKIYDPSEIYPGSYANRAPDIVVFPNFWKGYLNEGPNILGKTVLKGQYFSHHPIGVLAVSGDGIDRLTTKKPLPNYAVAQIILCLLKQPLPKGRDRINLVEKIFCTDLREANYLSRWKIMKKIRGMELRKS